jgi:putative transposase
MHANHYVAQAMTIDYQAIIFMGRHRDRPLPCTQSRLPLFGEIIEGHMYLNPAGQMIQTTWQSIPEHYAGWIADIWVVMPDHVHVILVHHCDTERTDTHMMARADTGIGPYTGNISLPNVMRNIKSHTTFHYIRGVHEHRWPVFYKRLWQRGYHDHVIRHTNDLSRIRKYILDNPFNWEQNTPD